MRASSPIEALTAEQTAALDRYRVRWLAIRRSTAPCDRVAAEQGVRLAYQTAELNPPSRMIWCDSPVDLSDRARRASRTEGPNVKSAVIDRPRRQAAARVRARLRARIRAQVERAVNPADALIASVVDAVVQGTGAAHDGRSLLGRLQGSRPLSWRGTLNVLLGRDGFRYSAAGPAELSWLGPYEYVRDVLDLREETEPLLGLWQVAMNVGWLQPHEHTCWLSERPNVLRGDAEARLHHASGPALRFADGWSVFAWKGVEVPRWMIEHPGTITLAAIDAETNVQLRRCMIEIMTPQRFVALGGARKIAADETGVLWRRIWFNYDIWSAVEVINATPEPDGTHKHFFLQVPANIQTAREAVAWTYGMRADEYANVVVRT
ncbi:DUF6745 domain-containing protein [Bradyrhizobium sp. ARR65]|uniref:DUF6745 domain-containing protein n=1 Tax=Bradyrhizobium sp. ARR65 TaxID=1040989 RepID=UPI0004673E8E|nr:hypothetical protein [Bradyrhizobium sp. ARR65]